MKWIPGFRVDYPDAYVHVHNLALCVTYGMATYVSNRKHTHYLNITIDICSYTLHSI